MFVVVALYLYYDPENENTFFSVITLYTPSTSLNVFSFLNFLLRFNSWPFHTKPVSLTKTRKAQIECEFKFAN